jgi:NNP family nitrate/nitrite transporter-like MFS transporter
MIVASLLIIMAMVFVFWGKNAPGWKPAKGSSISRLIVASKLRLTWDLSSVYAVTFGAFVAFGVYLPVLLKVSYDLSLTDAAARAAGFVLLATIARPVGGWLSDKVGARRVVQATLCTIIPLAAFVAFQPTLEPQTTVAYLTLAFVLGCANGAVFAMVGKLAKPEVMGSVTGIVGAAGGFGGFLPPLILGFTYQRMHSYSLALVLLSAAAFVVLIYIHRRFKDKSLYAMV